MARPTTFYRFIFADGTAIVAAGFDRIEMQALVRDHGKLVSKERY